MEKIISSLFFIIFSFYKLVLIKIGLPNPKANKLELRTIPRNLNLKSQILALIVSEISAFHGQTDMARSIRLKILIKNI